MFRGRLQPSGFSNSEDIRGEGGWMATGWTPPQGEWSQAGGLVRFRRETPENMYLNIFQNILKKTFQNNIWKYIWKYIWNNISKPPSSGLSGCPPRWQTEACSSCRPTLRGLSSTSTVLGKAKMKTFNLRNWESGCNKKKCPRPAKQF